MKLTFDGWRTKEAPKPPLEVDFTVRRPTEVAKGDLPSSLAKASRTAIEKLMQTQSVVGLSAAFVSNNNAPATRCGSCTWRPSPTLSPAIDRPSGGNGRSSRCSPRASTSRSSAVRRPSRDSGRTGSAAVLSIRDKKTRTNEPRSARQPHAEDVGERAVSTASQPPRRSRNGYPDVLLRRLAATNGSVPSTTPRMIVMGTHSRYCGMTMSVRHCSTV